MKKARIILAAVAVCALAGGVLAFNAPKTLLNQAFTTTTRISTVINGVTYYKVTAPASPFCTTTNRWVTAIGPTVLTLTSSAELTGSFSTGTLTTIATYPTCTTTTTATTAVQ